MVDYLPKDANSTQAIKILENEFDDGLPNLSVMVKDVSLQEGLDYKEKLEQIEGITSVMWLDDIIGKDKLTSTPLTYLDPNITDKYYKDGTALFSVVVETGKEAVAVEGVYQLIGENNAALGAAITSAGAQASSTKEVMNAMMILVPIIILILIIATESWLEPILFMLAIGVAIIINMGTNIIFGEVSFITKTVSPVLQLAVSLDYAIFLLHSFTEKRKKYEPKEAMFLAMKASLPTIAASAMTTIIGFSALIFMRFGIGADLGLNLLKGISLSFLSVMIFLPVLTLITHKWIDKTMHREFLPHPSKISKLLVMIRIPALILALLVVIPAFLGQSHISFLYGMGVESSESRSYTDRVNIEAVFGKEQPLLLMVPKENIVKELQLSTALSDMPFVNQVLSYADNVGTTIPTNFVPNEAYNQFYSDHYARIIIYTNLETEGDATFEAIDQIMTTTGNYYDDYYLTGESAALRDMKNVVAVDMGRINLIAVVGIFIVLMLTFKSISIPLFLIFTIESAIWINLSVPYFTDSPLSFIGYLIISTVQLGATVDYAILMTHRYMDERQKTSKKEAMWQTIKNNVAAVLISASILATAGFTLAGTTNNPVIKELGTLLGRGTVLSCVMVVAVLPALLLVFDKIIKKTTLAHGFHQETEEK